MMRKTLYYLLFVMGLPAMLQAQRDSMSWHIRWVEVQGISDRPVMRQILREAQRLKNESDLHTQAAEWARRQDLEGRSEFSMDGYSRKGDTLYLQFHPGPAYVYEQLTFTGLNEAYQQRSGLDRLVPKKAPLDWEDLEERLRYCLNLFQDEGYPFATFDQTALRYLPLSPDSVGARISYQFDPGPLIVLDSVIIKGNHREKDEFVYSLTRIRPGEPYQHRLIADAARLLNNSIYYERVPSPRVTFTPWNTAKVALELKRKRAGKFDLLLGLLPPDQNNDKLQFTGTVDMVFVSPFRMGEILQFKYDKLTSTSNRLEMQMLVPHVLRTPFQLEGELNILKQQEDFQNRFFRLGGQYAFSPFFAAKFNYRDRNSSLLDLTAFENDSLNGPSLLDGTQRMYGVGFVYEQLDYRLNPTRGASLSMEARLGRRTIRENFRLPGEIYENLPAELPAREITFSGHWYKQLFPRHVVHLAQQTYWLGQEEIFRNDQQQVGGARSIRGFNENQFFANFVASFTAEYRFLLERNSYLMLFGDYAYLENAVDREVLRPLGLGLGMNYGTEAGIISLSYAIGKTADIPFQPSRGKVHIGFINQF
jgi:outer membrane protein assembly factor BamA